MKPKVELHSFTRATEPRMRGMIEWAWAEALNMSPLMLQASLSAMNNDDLRAVDREKKRAAEEGTWVERKRAIVWVPSRKVRRKERASGARS